MYDEHLGADEDTARVAFERAVAAEILSKNPEAENFAGKFVFMSSPEHGAGFKHIETRQYLHHKRGGAS